MPLYWQAGPHKSLLQALSPASRRTLLPVIEQSLALQAGIAPIARLQSVETRLLRRAAWYVQQTGPLFDLVRIAFRRRHEALLAILSPVFASTRPLLLGLPRSLGLACLGRRLFGALGL